MWLLGTSYYFYMCWNTKYLLLLLAVTGITYAAALIIEYLQKSNSSKKASIILGVTIIIDFALLFYFKYINFLIYNINQLLGSIGKNTFSALDIILPVGLSFFIFQAIGYVIDVFRKNIHAEKNFFKYALFLAFFPQLVAGPIGRAKNLLTQFSKPIDLDGQNLREGLVYLLFGVWQKVVLADNIAAIVNPVYTNYDSYSGMQILLATMLFGVQIYCDFGGYTNIARGSAKILGIQLARNFNAPYMAIGITDFWSRWHISLTSWFRDYLYIPLGGNRRGTLRKYINTMIVFAASGVWHGAAWNYVFWGALNGLFIVFEDIWRKIYKKNLKNNNSVTDKLDINKWIKRIITFLLIDFTWLFFRAPSLSGAVRMIKHSFSHPGLRGFLLGNDLSLFGSNLMLAVILMSIMILLCVGIMNERGINKFIFFFQQKEWIRWIVYMTFLAMIILYGAYGEGYEQTQFIYFQF